DVMVKELGVLVKSVVWFGSAVRGGFAPGKTSLREEVLFGSDIDVLIVFDDMVNVLTPEIITAYRIVTEKTASNISKRLHITTMPLTKMWDYSLKGDPILINMLRDGRAVYDVGCFGMAQKMLGSKRIAPSKEIVWIYLARGPMSVANAEWNMKESVLDLYWSVLDAAHAALLHYDVVPESPEQIILLMKHHLVLKDLMDKKYLSVVGEFMNVGKMLMSGEVHKVSGDHYDRYRKEAVEFIHVVKELISTK
ncbi:nucleotidyltransferase domain-containing protein, partial [archaeon]|nr:nucleotidyltransferase domain-containing protein [archaeon]